MQQKAMHEVFRKGKRNGTTAKQHSAKTCEGPRNN
jgi:hypothetical protein